MARKTIAQYRADAGKLELVHTAGTFTVWAGKEWAEVRSASKRQTLKEHRGKDARAEAIADADARKAALDVLMHKIQTDSFY